jgi:acyl dehydratase
MEVTSEYTGAESKPLEWPITPRHSMNFAASTQDLNPLYFDDEREDGIIAPPMIAVALTWPFGETHGKYWERDKFPIELLARQVHYTETLVYERMIVPGEKLTLQAQLVSVKPHRAGTELCIRSQARDEKGDLVFTEYAGSMLLKVKCTDDGASATDVPELVRFKTKEDPIWTQKIHMSPIAAHLYDGCADIHNPIHTSPKTAHGVGLPGPIIHGTLTLATAVREIVDREGGGDPHRLKRVQCRFTDMVLPDTDIKVELQGTESADDTTKFYFQVLNGNDRRAISGGLVVLGNA